MVLEVVKQYRRYLQDCLSTYEELKDKTCPADDDDYRFWNQRDNPKFFAYILFPIFKDCDLKFIEFSYEDQSSLIKENGLYWTIAFSKWDTKDIEEWFIKNTDFSFSIESSPPYDLLRISAKDIVDMIYSAEMEESSEQCEGDKNIFGYTEPPSCISYDGDWILNER